MKLPLIPPSRCTSTLPNDLEKSYLIAEPKLDGSRYVLYLGQGCDPYERQRGNTLLSRRVSTVDHKHVDRTLNIPHITGIEYAGLEGTIIDGEIQAKDFLATNSVMNSGPALAVQKQETGGYVTYHVWDCMVFRGQDIRGRSLAERRKVLEAIIERMGNPHVIPVPQITTNLQDYFTQIVQGGGEGIIVKDTRLGYGTGWSKMKKVTDVSCVITGFKPGNGKYADSIGSIALSVHKDGKLVEVGFASGFKDDIRLDIAKNPKKYLGTVVDVFCQEVQKTDNPRLRHPTFNRFRDDFSPTDCTWEKVLNDLKTKIKNNRFKFDK